MIFSNIRNIGGGWGPSILKDYCCRTTTTLNNVLLQQQRQLQQQCRYFFSDILGGNKSPPPVKKQISRVLRFKPEQVYKVISNVQLYKTFLPFCIESRVVKVVNQNCFEAELTVGSGAIKESYLSRVTHQSPVFVESTAINSSLFYHLTSKWKFRDGPSKDSCITECTLEYQFKSPFYSTLMDQFFVNSLDAMLNSFERRCNEIYK
eukprot:gene1419-1791_t